MSTALDPLLERRSEFLAYLRKQGAPADQAEDVLQAALARGLEPWSALPSAPSLVPWFYRVLHNALVDHGRRATTARAAVERLGAGEDGVVLPVEPRRVCRCTRKVLASLKPEYAALIEAVDVAGRSIDVAAEAAGITKNNAYVRLHRARRALRERLESFCGGCATGAGHCSDCYCQSSDEV